MILGSFAGIVLGLTVLHVVSPVNDRARAAARIEFHVSPFVDLYSYVRCLADSEQVVPDLPGLDAAVRQAKAIGAGLGSPLEWGVFDANASLCENAREAIEVMGRLPDSVDVAGAHPVAAREPGVALARALADVEGPFMDRLWPFHQAAIDTIRAELARSFEPKEADCFAFNQDRFALLDPRDPIPVFLVARSPRPHGVTHLRHDRTGVCFVGTEDASPISLLMETILHEATHALDVGSPASLLAEIRDSLMAGPARIDRRTVRNAVHTLLFIQAGATVRRCIDPEHVDYGVARGYYAKVDPIAALEIPTWSDYASRRITRQEAVGRIVSSVRGIGNPQH